MKRSLLKISTAIIGSLFFVACGDKKPVAPNPATIPAAVTLYGLQPQKALYYDKFPGTVIALMQVDIRPVVEGYVTGIFFTEGSMVSKGQKLYTIDDSKYKASFNQFEANVKVAESNMAQAQKDADRYIYLNEHEAVAKQLLDHALTTLQNSKNELAAAKQTLAKAQTDLNYSVIKAPFDGTIGLSQVKVGNTVIPGQTVMNTISTTDPMAVDFVVNEKQLPRFMKLKDQNNNALDSIFSLQLPDNSIYPIPGQISVIDRGVNPQTGTITLRLKFPNSGGTLRAGMSCNVRVRNTDTTAQLMIPGRAIVEQMGEYFVYVAKDTLMPFQDTTIKVTHSALHSLQKKVMLGQTINDKVIVKSGLQAGDSIVVEGVQKIRDGSLIRTGELIKK